jgi:DNA (cytosine-5)-methyltransferase 1
VIGSLFSGIGGLELGLERAGLGPVAWQVEGNEYCRGVLAEHWPRAERRNDVRTVGAANLQPVDLICGGFPCQDVSAAGSGKGLDGSRSGLWREFARIVGELRPSWVVVENVSSAARRWVDRVVSNLGQHGYASMAVPLSACDVGAPHRRNRIFVIAADTVSFELRNERQRQPGGRKGTVCTSRQAVVGASCAAWDATDSNPSGLRTLGQSQPGREQRPSWDFLDRCNSQSGGWGPPESVLRGMDDGISRELDAARGSVRLAALGNAVVPQCAEVIGWMIRELIDENQDVER